MAKAPDPRRVRAKQVQEAVKDIRWVVEDGDGKQHTFWLAEVSALDVGALRREAQMSVRQMILDAEDEQLDAMAAVIWMARRQAGEAKLTYEDVAAELKLGELVIVRHEDDPEPESEDLADPPPSGGSFGE